jgi:splicing factor 3A subunit 3
LKTQSERARQIYLNQKAERTQELQSISTGDTFESFFHSYQDTKQFHKRYPGQLVDDLERAYKRPEDGGPPNGLLGTDISAMFRAEEKYGRFFDLTLLHEDYMNLPGVRGVKKQSYLGYLGLFDVFTPPKCPISRKDKMTDEYFSYVRSLAEYLESFFQRIRPLEDSRKLYQEFDDEFDELWERDEVLGWERILAQSSENAPKKPATEGSGKGIWCADCAKEFSNDATYKSHLTGKKHLKNAEARQKAEDAGDDEKSAPKLENVSRLKERAVAFKEHRIRKLASIMQTEREDTRVDIERRAGLTPKEREQEIAARYAEEMDEVTATALVEDDQEQDGDEKVYNPLKLPLAWDGKPIPFWLYKLHGLGVEFSCEICGNYVYMGRRAFDKHFSEQRHIYGLNCLGINKNTSMFREITKIEEALKLWNKMQRDLADELEKRGGETGDGVVEMEDSMGNVMPKAVYEDLATAGLL